MRIPTAAVVCAALSLQLPVLLAGQELQGTVTSVREGARVRLTVPTLRPQKRVGEFSRMVNDSVFFLRESRSDSLVVPLLMVRSIEVSQGMSKRPRRMSILWGATGLVGGMLAARAVARANVENSTGCGFMDILGCSEEDMATGLAGVAGGLAGATIAFNLSRRPRETWRRVSITQR
ncbi:MAG: hypothetical protein ACRENU_13965 [Gemmatimonadaceae bacterium]